MRYFDYGASVPVEHAVKLLSHERPVARPFARRTDLPRQFRSGRTEIDLAADIKNIPVMRPGSVKEAGRTCTAASRLTARHAK